jgi:hypothetical protein
MGLGLLYVPCAGPVLTVISVVGASHRFSAGALVLTGAFAVGVGLPLLALALAGQRSGERRRASRLVGGSPRAPHSLHAAGTTAQSAHDDPPHARSRCAGLLLHFRLAA